MVNVSKKKLAPEIQDRLMRDFIALLSYPKTKKARRNLIEQFFTKSERELFAKRIALILMIKNDTPFSTVENELGVSPNTVDQYQRKLRHGKYRSITTALKHLYGTGSDVGILTVLFNTSRARKQFRKEMHDTARSIGAQIGTQ